jgi:hypothetical protein
MERKIDLTINQSCIIIACRAFDDAECDRGAGNMAQGVLIQSGLLVVDPLSDEEFGADIIIRQTERFSADKRAQRTLQLPLHVAEESELMVGSPIDEEATGIVLPAGDYTLIYEICLGRDVFYTLTLLPTPCETAKALKADGWGLKKDQVLQEGMF